LTLTHKQLKRMGIHGDRINPVIENLVVSGLLEVTHRGGPADPSRYRVTSLPHCIEEPNGRVVFYPPGNEWIEIELEIVEGKRTLREPRHVPPHRRRRPQNLGQSRKSSISRLSIPIASGP
jgi:hypothetical protein